MSPNASGKRRRLDNAASTLSKPFKSPFRKPLQTPEDKKDNVLKTSHENSNSSVPSSQLTNDDDTKHDIATLTPNSSAPHVTPTPPSIQSRKRKSDTTTPSRKSILLDPTTLDLQKQQRALQVRLSTLRSELDTTQQALRIESSNKDEELDILISKWRRVSQEAAEEVYSGAQERVSRMGGMSAWKKRMGGNNGWEQDDNGWFGNVEDAGEVDEEELEMRRAEIWERVDLPKEEGKKEDKEGEEEELTMDLMLKTLNIDLDLIGYDKLGQRWIKD